MVFQRLLADLANRYSKNDSGQSELVNDNELEQGLEFLNTRAREINEMTNSLSLINNDNFTTKPLDDATQRELNILNSLETNFQSELSSYGMMYTTFMDNYNKFVGTVKQCKTQCTIAYPVGSADRDNNIRACQAGCELKGPYISECKNTYKGTSGKSCQYFSSSGACSGGSIITGHEEAVNSPTWVDSNNIKPAQGCCDCGGGSGGPPTGRYAGNVIKNCSKIGSISGQAACKNAPYANAEGAANLWRDYNRVVAKNNKLMQLAQGIYEKIAQLYEMDENIKNSLSGKRSLLQQQLTQFRTTYTDLKNVKATATLTTAGIIEDLHLRRKAVDLRFYPWALLAISGILIAIYQLKKT